MDQILNRQGNLKDLSVLSREYDRLRSLPVSTRAALGHKQYQRMVREAYSRFRAIDIEMKRRGT